MDFGSNKTTNAFLGLAFIVGLAGTGVGYKAYIEYKKINELTTIQTLDANELKIWDLLLQDDNLNTVWAGFPENISIRERANRQLILLAGKDQYRNATKIFKNKWKYVGEIDSILYDGLTFYNPAKVNLRKGYGAMDRVIYLLNTAYRAKTRNMIENDIWDTYAGYIYDLGSHPMFLTVLSYWHDMGFYDKDFANMIKVKYMENSKLKGVVSEIYPEMKDKDWVNSIGKGRI